MSEAASWGIGAGVLGLISLGWAFVLYQRGVESRSWPSVEGTIVHVSVRHTGSSGAGNAEESRREWFVPVIEYTYSVRGRSYKGNRFFVGGLSSMEHGGALGMLQPYREGAKVTVFHDPKYPDSAVLETRADGNAVTRYAAVGVVLLLFAAVLLSMKGPS